MAVRVVDGAGAATDAARDYDVEGTATEYDRRRAAAARAVSAPGALARVLRPRPRVHGTARSGATLLFEGAGSTVAARGAGRSSATATAGRRELEGALRAAARPGARSRVELGRLTRARLRGDRRRSAHAGRLPRHRGRDARRRPPGTSSTRCAAISALFDPSTPCCGRPPPARRPGHGEELVSALLLDEGEPSGRRGGPHLDRLRRRGPPAQRRPRAVAAGRGLPAPRLRARWWPARRWSSRASTCTPRCSAGGWRPRGRRRLRAVGAPSRRTRRERAC